jgi:hypothetical protein
MKVAEFISKFSINVEKIYNSEEIREVAEFKGKEIAENFEEI